MSRRFSPAEEAAIVAALLPAGTPAIEEERAAPADRLAGAVRAYLDNLDRFERAEIPWTYRWIVPVRDALVAYDAALQPGDAEAAGGET